MKILDIDAGALARVQLDDRQQARKLLRPHSRHKLAQAVEAALEDLDRAA